MSPVVLFSYVLLVPRSFSHTQDCPSVLISVSLQRGSTVHQRNRFTLSLRWTRLPVSTSMSVSVSTGSPPGPSLERSVRPSVSIHPSVTLPLGPLLTPKVPQVPFVRSGVTTSFSISQESVHDGDLLRVTFDRLRDWIEGSYVVWETVCRLYCRGLQVVVHRRDTDSVKSRRSTRESVLEVSVEVLQDVSWSKMSPPLIPGLSTSLNGFTSLLPIYLSTRPSTLFQRHDSVWVLSFGKGSFYNVQWEVRVGVGQLMGLQGD